MSDLHLERDNYQFDPSAVVAPFLILAGDIGRFNDTDQYTDFMRRQCENFNTVLLIAGNHEFYGSSRREGLAVAEVLNQDAMLAGRFTFMHRTRLDLPCHHGSVDRQVVVLGCTLGSHIDPQCERLTNDFSRIRDWSVEQHDAEHHLDLQWLKQSLAELAAELPRKRVVIATYYAPAFDGTCHPSNERNAVSQCFCSDILPSFHEWPGADLVSHWIFGHTHWNASF